MSVRVHGAVEADSFTAGDTVDAGTTVAITTSDSDADRHRHPRGGAPNIPYPERGCQCPDATDVLCITHRHSSIHVLAERWPPGRKSSSAIQIVAPVSATSAVARYCNSAPVSARYPESRASTRACIP